MSGAEIEKSSAWYTILNGAMSMPGVRVDRREFLYSSFSRYYDLEKVHRIVENGTGRAGVDVATVDKRANNVISYHNRLATASSALAGLPGGWGLAIAIPADIAQFYGHTLSTAQKLAYLYGYPDLRESSDEDFLNYMTLFVGVMTGVAGAGHALKKLSQIVATQVEKKVAAAALTKGTLYPAVKQIAKLLGLKMTKEIFAKGVSKAIPLISAGISGGITYFSFKSQAHNLRDNLHDNYIHFQHAGSPTAVGVIS